mgnify:CR=1 FL=1
MTWKDIGKKVAEAAPLLGNVLAGPVGGAAGSLIATIFGTEPDPDAVMKKIEQDPQAYLKLKELELNHAAELERLALQAETARLADVQSARSREIEVVRATGERDTNLYALAWIVVLGFFVLTGALMAFPLQEGSSEVVFLLFGGLVAGFTQVLGYFFGSSKSSVDKTRMLKRGQ